MDGLSSPPTLVLRNTSTRAGYAIEFPAATQAVVVVAVVVVVVVDVQAGGAKRTNHHATQGGKAQKSTHITRDRRIHLLYFIRGFVFCNYYCHLNH